MKIVYVHADRPWEWNSAEFRCAVPARAISRLPRHRADLLSIEHFAALDMECRHHCDDADLIVLQRGAMPDTWRAIDHYRARGVTIIADIDDGYPQIPPSHPAHAYWHRGIIVDQTGQQQQLPRLPILDMTDGLRRVSALTSPSRLILDDWRQRVGVRCGYLPNYVETRRYDVPRRRAGAQDIWIGWGGSAGHYQSFVESGVTEALARLLPRYPLARFVVFGADVRVYDRIPVGRGRKYHIQWTPYERWPAHLAACDIMLIPLQGDFDARRSQLKPLECSLVGVPWIASRSPAYAGLEPYGVIVDNTPDAWMDAIERILRDGPDMHRLHAARRWGLTMDVYRRAPDIIALYERIIQGGEDAL